MSEAKSTEKSAHALSILRNESLSSSRELLQEIDVLNKSRWEEFLEIVWDGPKTAEERKYIRKLDIFLLTWGWYVGIVISTIELYLSASTNVKQLWIFRQIA